MAFVKVGSLSALPAGRMIEAEVNGNTYVVCNAGDGLFAYDNFCPHAGGPLAQGNIEDGNIICPWHAWEYNCRTGANGFDDSVRLEAFPVKTEGDDILIDVP